MKWNSKFWEWSEGSNNELALAAALKVSESPGKVYNPLYLYSEVGLGKTHLLHSIGHELVKKGKKIIYLTSETFTNEYNYEIYKNQNISKYVKHIKNKQTKKIIRYII